MLLVARSPGVALVSPAAEPQRRRREPLVNAKAPFNALLQSESFDAIKRNVDQLACLTHQFPGYQGVSSILITKEDLDAVSRLSGDIMSSLDKIAVLREQRHDAAHAPLCHHGPQSLPASSMSPSSAASSASSLAWSDAPAVEEPGSKQPAAAAATTRTQHPRPSRRRRHQQQPQPQPPPAPTTAAAAKPTCRRCGAVSTPKWRAGPAGLRTLCNVCGLMHSKRTQRAAGKASLRLRWAAAAP